MSKRSIVASILFLAAACADVAKDQGTEDPVTEPPRAPFGSPTAVFAEDFGYLHAVRELPDGDVLVADLFDKAVYRVDMEAQTRTMVGGRGETIRTRWAGALMPHDAWGVAADGSVVVARADAYGVDWISPDGSVIRGDTLPYAPIPLTFDPIIHVHHRESPQ